MCHGLPNSNCKGHDQFPYKTIKTIRHEIAPIITHLINRIISTNTFLDISKLIRILPFIQPNKLINLNDSYQPINN